MRWYPLVKRCLQPFQGPRVRRVCPERSHRTNAFSAQPKLDSFFVLIVAIRLIKLVQVIELIRVISPIHPENVPPQPRQSQT